MASAVTPPRQLAPTVGPVAALAGVFIRTGSITTSGERVLSGLVCKLGDMHFVSDNAGCLGSKPIPVNGCLITFGSIHTYVATELVCKYPARVLDAEDPPIFCAARGRCVTRPASCAEVMMTGAASGAGLEEDASTPGKSARPGRPPLERVTREHGDTSTVRPLPLDEVIERLAVPLVPGTGVALIEEELEQQVLRV